MVNRPKHTVKSKSLPKPVIEEELDAEEKDIFFDNASEYDDDDEEEEEEEVDSESDNSIDDDVDDEFEQQSSEDGDGDILDDSESEEECVVVPLPEVTRQWPTEKKAPLNPQRMDLADLMHTDDLSSDDEEAGDSNTVGRVPLHWYDAYDHIGYNVDGKKITKKLGKDRIDMAIANRDDPNSQRTIYDMYNDREVVLTDRELEIIRRIQAGAFAHPEHDDMPDYVDYFSSQKELMPLSGRPEPKHKFLPSKYEMTKVRKIVKAMQEGRYKTIAEREQEKRGDGTASDPNRMYLIWADDEADVLAESKRDKYHLPAPKMPLPGHAESYNPPDEYLLSAEEKEKMEDLDPEDRLYNFVPKKHDCLRHVAGYQNFIRERFERCLDLYLCPRKLKMRLNIDPETLVPRLPKPSELRPFPNSLCIQYLGHTKAVRSVSVSPDGQYFVSGSEDGTVRLWELDSGLCRYVWDLGSPVLMVAWNPNPSHHLVAAAAGKELVFIATGTGDDDCAEVTESLLTAGRLSAAAGQPDDSDELNDTDKNGSDDDNNIADDEGEESKITSKEKSALTRWVLCRRSRLPLSFKHDQTGLEVGPILSLQLSEALEYIVWHHKGDYIASLAPNAGTKAVAIHQLSKALTQHPFTKSPGNVQAISFHPSRPFIFLTTQQHIKVFDLVAQKMVKKLLSGCKWLSSADVHPSGDHIIVGSYDRRVVWFDLDLSSTPYKTLKFHEKAVRAVAFHKRYPLMASASDDGSLHVFHSTVYSDLSRNPLIVPLKILRGHGVSGAGKGGGVVSVAFHPRQPWLLSAGADCVINLYQDI